MEMDVTQQTALTAQVRNQLRATGAAGLAAVVLLFAGQGFMQAGGTAEPAFDAPTAVVRRYLETRNAGLFSIGAYLEMLGLAALLSFVCGIYTALRGDSEQPPWLPTVALASGTATVGSLLLGAWQLAPFRINEGLDPQLGRFAFDMANLSFANAWVALGSFAVAVGWAIRSSRSLPGWLGWWVLAAGIGLIAARAVWTTSVWFIPYALFWLWVIVLSVRLLAGKPSLRP
jgi:hypothetical protein